MGLFDTDVSGRLVAGDQRFRQLALAGAPIGSGRAPWTNAAPDARAEIEVAWARAVTLGGEFDTEATITQSNGVPARVRFVIAPRHAPDGTLTGYSGVVIRAAVAEPDDHRDRHIARMSDAFLAVDADSMVVFANPSAFALVGLDPASASVGESALRNLALAMGASRSVTTNARPTASVGAPDQRNAGAEPPHTNSAGRSEPEGHGTSRMKSGTSGDAESKATG